MKLKISRTESFQNPPFLPEQLPAACLRPIITW
jgi:hypothetical protein